MIVQAMFAVTVLLIVGVATLLSLWCGWGLARLALPPALMPFRAMLTPLIGTALVMFLGYLAVWTIFSVAQALPIILVLCGLLNLFAWRRTGPPRFLSNLREHAALALVLLVTLLMSLAPLLNYGHAAVIGGGWDVESALPTTRYLERGPISAMATQPDNPLRDLVSAPPRIGKTLGFAIWQAAVDILTGSEAIVSFTPLLAWMRTLGILGVYVLFRATLKLEWLPALFGTLLASAGALMLWITYFNFEKQLAGWPLIPLGLILSVAAVEYAAGREQKNKGSREQQHQGTVAPLHTYAVLPGAGSPPPALVVLLLAAVALVAQAIAYYPALTIWAPLAIGLGLAVLIESPGMRLRLLGFAGLLGVITALLGIPTIIDYFAGFSGRYDNQVTTLGVFRYVPFTDIVGTTAFSLANQFGRNPGWLEWAGTALVGGLAILAVARRPERARWIGLLIGAGVYLAWLRWGQEYAYAYMKGAAYTGFVFAGAAAAGWQALQHQPHATTAARTNPRRGARMVIAGGLALLLLLQLSVAQYQVVAEHWQRPGLYPNELPALLELRRVVPPGSTVNMTSDVRVQGVISGIAANLLDHAVVWGRVRTGYASDSAGPTDVIGEYGLLYADEDPAPRGYRELIWRGGSFALYRRPPELLAHLRLERELAAGASLAAELAPERFNGAAQADAVLRVAAFAPARIAIGASTLELPAGVSAVRVAVPPGSLPIRNTGDTAIMVQWLTLETPDAAAPPVAAIPATALVQARASADASTITTVIDALLPDGGPVTLALDIWDTPRGVQYGWYGAKIGLAPGTQTLTLTLDLPTGTMTGLLDDGSVIPLGTQFQGLQRGDFTARLQVSAGGVLLTEPTGLFAFRVDDARNLSDAQTWALPPLAATLNRPPEPLQAQIGDDTLLLGYDLLPGSVPPGATVQLTLWWQAVRSTQDERSVLIHLLDASGERRFQADGPPTGGLRPTGLWQAGETILDAREIRLPPDVLPGDYTLVIGMYRWPSLERLPLTINGVRQEGDVIRLPLRVER